VARKLLRIYYHPRFGAFFLLTNSALAPTPQFEIDTDHTLTSTLFSYLSCTDGYNDFYVNGTAQGWSARSSSYAVGFFRKKKDDYLTSEKRRDCNGPNEPHIVGLTRNLEFATRDHGESVGLPLTTRHTWLPRRKWKFAKTLA
jgi:hypothetical protein